MSSPGYRHGLIQAGQRKNISFNLPEEQAIARIDVWIREALETDPQSLSLRLARGVKMHARAVAYLSRLLLVTRTLLQDIKLGLFETAVLESITVQGQRVQAQLWMPEPEGHPSTMVDAWLQRTLLTLRQLARTFGSDAAREAAYQSFHQQQVEPWRTSIPGGQSTISLLQAAFDHGVVCTHLNNGRYLLGWGSRSDILSKSANTSDSAIGASLTKNKSHAVHMMRAAGLPTPRGVLMPKDGFSPTLIEPLPRPWVIKPVDRDRGEGVSLNLHTLEQAKTAFDAAAALSSGVLAEEQIAGTCHRILVVDGQVVYVVKRHPKSVTGDGQHSVAELVAQRNAELQRLLPIKRLPLYALDEAALAQLATQGIDPHSVPAPGQNIPLRPAQSTVWGGEPEEVTERLHPQNAALAIQAARLFRLRCAGIDFISTDISVPWWVNGAAINEVNFSPVIGRTHAYQRRAAAAYIQALFPQAGRIPIEMYIGQDQAAKVTQRQAFWGAQGLHVRLCSDAPPQAGATQDSATPPQGPLYEAIARTRYDPQVDVLLIHLTQASSLTWPALPVPWLSRISISPPLAKAVRASALWAALAPHLAHAPENAHA